MAIDRIYRGMLNGLEALGLRRARPRQARLYCVGAPRTGTHSIARIFDRAIRSGHEPAFRSTTAAVLAHHRGELPFDDLRRFVRERDAKLRLDVDSSHANAFLIAALRAEFADARFLLTIRDCFSWLDSALDHSLNARGWSAADRDWLEFWFDTRSMRYAPHDEPLRERGLPGIECHLAAWHRHNERALTSVPPEQLLVVRTNEIGARLPEIATFAGVARDRLAANFTAQGVARAKHGLLDEVDPAWLADRAAEHCGALMTRFFPQVRSLRDARAGHSASP